MLLCLMFKVSLGVTEPNDIESHFQQKSEKNEVFCVQTFLNGLL